MRASCASIDVLEQLGASSRAVRDIELVSGCSRESPEDDMFTIGSEAVWIAASSTGGDVLEQPCACRGAISYPWLLACCPVIRNEVDPSTDRGKRTRV